MHNSSPQQPDIFDRIRDGFHEIGAVQKGTTLIVLAGLVGGGAFGCSRVAGGAKLGMSKSGAASALAAPLGKGSGLGAGIDEAIFERVGEALDNPQAIFNKAGYQPLWTASKSEVASVLPKGLSVMPKEARVWEPSFRKHITNKNGEPLSTADILKMKWTVIQTVANDPACQFIPGQSSGEIFQSVEAARIKALNSLGLDDSNSVIFQMSRADAAFARVKSQRNYTPEKEAGSAIMSIENGKPPRYPTFSQLNQQNFGLNCGRSALEMLYVLRGLEKIKPSGVQIGNVYVFRFDTDKDKLLAHSLNGVTIKLPDGGKAHLYYDPTASKGNFRRMGLSMMSVDAGPIDRASLERFGNRMSITVNNEQPNNWQKDGKDYVGYEYVLGENHPEFGLGNFDRSATLPEGGFFYVARKRGIKSFRSRHQEQLPQIGSLARTVDDVFSGRL